MRTHVIRDSERERFIKNYLEKRREIDGNKELVTEEDVDKLLMLTKQAELVLSLSYDYT